MEFIITSQIKQIQDSFPHGLTTELAISPNGNFKEKEFGRRVSRAIINSQEALCGTIKFMPFPGKIRKILVLSDGTLTLNHKDNGIKTLKQHEIHDFHWDRETSAEARWDNANDGLRDFHLMTDHEYEGELKMQKVSNETVNIELSENTVMYAWEGDVTIKINWENHKLNKWDSIRFKEWTGYSINVSSTNNAHIVIANIDRKK